MTALPPRNPGVELLALDPEDSALTVGKCFVPGAGLRIGIMLQGKLIHMSPAGARRVAKSWETPQAKAAALDWVATALREAADEIDAEKSVKQ